MPDKSDAQLLREYAENGREPAFRELVERHADLVYSVALRCVNSSDLAADVAQQVFSDLARKARPISVKLAENASLVGWLYRAARFAALNEVRNARRRLANERQAMEQLLIKSETASDWERIRPILDEAMDGLEDADREALLLRYFKNSDFRAVGLALGVSDDAAQKRVSRAVERLREFFAKRGVAVGAGGLVTLVTANAVQAAPVGLVATISSAAVVSAIAAPASTAVIATKTIAMTTLQKTVVGAALALTIGTGAFEAHQNSKLRDEVQTLKSQQSPVTEQLQQIQQLQGERDDATNRVALLQGRLAGVSNDNTELVRLRAEVSRLRSAGPRSTPAVSPGLDPNDPSVQHFLAAREVAQNVERYLNQMPDKKIPELKLLTDVDWLMATKDAKFDTDADIRKALSQLRSKAKDRIFFGSSLFSYTHSNNGQLPTDISQLKPIFKSTLIDRGGNIDDATLDAIFDRYALLHTGNVADYPSNTWFIVEKAPVDKEYDSRAKFGIGTGTTIATGLGEAGDPDDKSY